MPPLRYLALGDSYTIGEGVAPSERWPEQLAAMLRTEGIGIGSPEIVAKTGWTTDELNAAIDAASLEEKYDLVSLLVGVNNQYRGRSAVEYRAEFERLLLRAAGFAGGEPRRVVVLSIPDWGVTPFAEGHNRGAIAREIDEYNEIACAVAESHGSCWVEVTSLTRAAAEDLAQDRLHPSAAMYRSWAVRALPAARRALAAGRGPLTS